MSDKIDFYQEEPAFWEQLIAGVGGEGEVLGDASAGSGVQNGQPMSYAEQAFGPQYDHPGPFHTALGVSFGDASQGPSLLPFPNCGQSMHGSFSMASHEPTSPDQSSEHVTNRSAGFTPSSSNGLEPPALDNTILVTRNINVGVDAPFRFESGAIPIDGVQIHATNPRASPDPNSLRCDYPGCRSRRTFKRKYELQRHMRKHDGETAFSCPFDGCDRKDGNAFYRFDKLTDHLKKAHRDDENCMCFELGCQIGSMQFDLAKVHSNSHGFGPKDYWTRAMQALRRFEDEYRQCRLKDCAKWLPIGKIHEHLRGHPGHERLDQISAVKEMGYDAETCNVLCPICSHKSPDHETFALHVDSHGVRSNEHAIAFWNHMKGMLAGRRMPDLPENAWKIWRISSYSRSVDFLRVLQTATCPVCGDSVGRMGSGYLDEDFFVDHHLKALEDSSEIQAVRLYRREILRVYPEFKEHPVFYDISPISYDSWRNTVGVHVINIEQ